LSNDIERHVALLCQVRKEPILGSSTDYDTYYFEDQVYKVFNPGAAAGFRF
jgi:hypothetical protein